MTMYTNKQGALILSSVFAFAFIRLSFILDVFKIERLRVLYINVFTNMCVTFMRLPFTVHHLCAYHICICDERLEIHPTVCMYSYRLLLQI